MKSSAAIKLISVLITCLVPVVLILTTIRLMLMPWFLVFEYHTPGFPPDSYGFTLSDRLTYGTYALDYLVNAEDISYLADLRFPPGVAAPPPSCQAMTDCNRLFNERELAHMEDVKRVTQQVLRVWRIALLLFGVLVVFAYTQGLSDDLIKALSAGGWLTALICGVILLGVLLSFSLLFILFHDIFFAPGTWMFLTSDTLIRLFPERFWRDVFLFALGLPALIGSGLGWGLGKRSKA